MISVKKTVSEFSLNICAISVVRSLLTAFWKNKEQSKLYLKNKEKKITILPLKFSPS